jgi:prepilin-type N-terminal cleavage/methylation domain-containing protein
MCRRRNNAMTTIAPPRVRASRRFRRSGVTLVEMLIAASILSIMAVAIGTLALTVHTSNHYVQSLGTATQHGRVAIERIQRNAESATASENFPGFAVFGTVVGTATFPDTLVVWKPSGAPANPNGPPLVRELIVYAPDPAGPNRLLEITAPADDRTTPALSDTAGWAAILDGLKSGNSSSKVVLTDRLRTGLSGSTDPTTALRGAARFEVLVRPSMQEWADYKAGTLAWNDVPFALTVRGTTAGLRQCWCRIELHLLAPLAEGGSTGVADEAIPFFGSAALYHELRK